MASPDRPVGRHSGGGENPREPSVRRRPTVEGAPAGAHPIVNSTAFEVSSASVLQPEMPHCNTTVIHCM